MNYKDVNDLKDATHKLAHELPTNIDVVVGIPRSGLLAANLLCLHLDVPMTDVDGLLRGDLIDTGNRHGKSTSLEDIETVLVFDDSVLTGTQMTETQQRLAEEEFPFDIKYGAAYVTRFSHTYVDHWGDIVPRPRVFEWNIMHHPLLRNSCVDIDGILCRDPTTEENDDGENYRKFLRQVDPKIVPNNRIGCLVTCRLEKYREQTEAWLDEHGIEYDNLIMMDHPNMEARQEAGDHAEYKARIYNETDAPLFIESSHQQAQRIHKQTSKPVYCYESNEMFQPGRIDQASRKSADYLSRFRKRPIDFPQSAAKYVLRRIASRIRRGVSD